MTDEDISLDEKRVFEGGRGTAVAFVASDLGLARVEVSDDQIGRFGLVHRGETRDVTVDPDAGTIVAATDEDVLVGRTLADESNSDSRGENAGNGSQTSGQQAITFEKTDFGPAIAVTMHDGIVAADADGRVARYDDEVWTTIERIREPIAAMDGDLVATEVGVYRLQADDDPGVALAEVDDVAAAGPLAATGGGLFHLDEGVWRGERRGDATAVAATADSAVGVVDEDVLERAADGWEATDCPASTIGEVADVAAGRATYAITTDGTLYVDPPTAKDGAAGWASRSLGLADVSAIAVLEATE